MWSKEKELATLLLQIKIEDKNYNTRNKLVMIALGLAITIGYKAGIRIDSKEPEWPVIYIELPNGQVSWHIEQHQKLWDEHTTKEKYERIDQYYINNIVVIRS